MASRYFLLPHVFVCLSGDHVVFLDVKRHRYRALHAAATRGLDELVPGWPQSCEHRPPVERVHALANKLLQEGILTESDHGKVATSVRLAPPGQHLLPAHDAQPAPLRAGVIANLLHAYSVCCWIRRRHSLERVLRRVRSRKARNDAPRQQDDLELARTLIASYMRMRPYLLTSRDACLFESFLVLEFLSRYGVDAEFVLGVRMQPWLAHCWLQRGDTVLNDTIEHVRLFTPILAV